MFRLEKIYYLNQDSCSVLSAILKPDRYNTTKSNQKDQRLIDAKISLLQLAEELGNIQKACKAAKRLTDQLHLAGFGI